jgi:hypothetical protein
MPRNFWADGKLTLRARRGVVVRLCSLPFNRSPTS